MATLGTRLAATAQRLTSKYGVEITITAANGTYNPATRTTTANPTSATVKAAPGVSRYRFIVSGQEVQAEKKFTVAGLSLPAGFVPKAGHKVKTESGTFVVVGVDDAATADGVAAYDLHVRA